MSDGRHITELLARVETLEEGAENGGSSSVDRALYDTATPHTTVTADTFTLLPWRYDDVGLDFEPLDDSDPTQPSVVEAGLYVVTVTFNCTANHAGKASQLGLYLDANGSGGYATALIPLEGLTQGDTSTIAPQMAVTVPWYCEAGSVFNAFVVPNVTSDWFIEGVVQRFSGPAT